MPYVYPEFGDAVIFLEKGSVSPPPNGIAVPSPRIETA